MGSTLMEKRRPAMAAGAGYAVVRLLSGPALRRLNAEAWSAASGVGVYVKEGVTPDEGEGEISCALATAPGGPRLAAFITGAATLKQLERLTGRRWLPRRSAGTYTYYCRAGHHMDHHRDVQVCELSVITCLHDEPGTGGDLLLYPTRLEEPLSVIRATPRRGAVRIRLEPGQTLVMYGSRLPHCVTPIKARRTRIVAAVCYREAVT